MINIAIFPNLSFEIAVATFVNKKKYKIIPIIFTKKDEKFGQNLFGEWCYPLKVSVAILEEAVMEKNVKKIISFNVSLCSYPLVMGDIQKWLDKEVEYYPVPKPSLAMDISFPKAFFDQLQKAFPDFSLPRALKKVPLVFQRIKLGDKLRSTYFKTIPKVKSPIHYRTIYLNAREKLINADNFEASKKVVDNFKIISKNLSVEKTKFRFLLSGDLSIITTEFALLNLDVFMGQNRAELVIPSLPSKADFMSNEGKRAKKIYSIAFSNKHSTVESTDKHEIEIATLHQIIKGLDKNIDGIIFIKPNMCNPCDNLSFVLKKNNFFDFPYVEISYDEHSGVNGVITRLEAFMNIVDEKLNFKD